MDEQVMRFRVGVMFLATLLIAAILLVMFGKLPRLVGGTYSIQVEFPSASGVTNYTPVRKSGILIGRVSGVKLIDKDSKVLMTLDIQANRIVYQNEECYISRDILGGDTALVFVPVPGKPGVGTPVAPGAILRGLVSDDPTGLKKTLERPITTVSDTGAALTDASRKLGAAADLVGETFDASTRRNVQKVFADAAQSMQAIQKIIGDEENQQKLSEALKKLPDTLDKVNRTFNNANAIVEKFNEPSKTDGRTAIDRMLDTIEITERMLHKFTDETAEGRPAPVDQVARAMENINEITRLMREILARIDRGEGSLGAMMHDRQLYDRFNRAARNIEEITCKLQPIIDDARVFSDKAARHPGIIIRDAVRPGAGIK